LKTRIQHFDGAEAKMKRLGLGPLLAEMEKMLRSHVALLAEEK